MDNTGTDRPILTAAVRELAEKTERRGGLLSPFFAGITGPEGNQIHREFFDRARDYFPGFDLHPELSLKSLYRDPELPFDLSVGGRLDLLATHPDGRAILVEVKGFRGDKATLPAGGDPAHLAQALLYGRMLYDQEDLGLPPSLTIQLRYLPLEGREGFLVESRWTRAELEREWKQILAAYTRQVTPLYLHLLARNRANQEASFPYLSLRDGQKEMMQEVISAIRDKTVLFVQAPTGIGKTMATLYPAVKAQANGLTDRIFYLTPTRSQRQVAEESLDQMAAEGFLIRSLTLRAKEQMCLSPEHFCDMKQCPYALSFYDHLPDANFESYKTLRLLPETILSISREFKICPFEFQLSLLPTTDAVICDYNYIFNPRVRFQDFLDDPKHRYTLLVDEAHNLARRSREMFSAILQKTAVQTLYQGLDRHRQLPGINRGNHQKALETAGRLLAAMDRFEGRILAPAKEDEASFWESQHVHQPMRQEGFLASRSLPENWKSWVTALAGLLTRFFQDHPDFPGRQILMPAYFDLLFFQRVLDRYYDDAYITTFRSPGKGDLFATLLALDASRHLTDIYRGRSPVVFFSATLSPLPYYLSLLDARSAVEKPEVIRLKSPFSSDRRLVVTLSSYSIRYKDRARTLPEVAALIRDVTRLRQGHYLVFSPSFAYQKQLVRHLSALKAQDIDFVVQPPRMTESQKENFLSYFRSKNRTKPLVGLTVIGSLFNEGVDLVGEELTGVIIIGTGMPGISPERDILRQYYDQKSGRGFEFAYVWPGFNRVTQAAGRLIRSEEDFGFILLVDDRYEREDYRQLMPPEWKIRPAKQADESLELISEFWQDMS